MEIQDWHGSYNESWRGEIASAAFSHPAKFPRGVIRRIYDEMLARGWLRPGATVLDPFGGVALGALDAMRHGLNWHGVELEAHFVRLGTENIALWNARYAGAFPKWGTARLIQGDSRNLQQLLGVANGAVSSPPYTNSYSKGGEVLSIDEQQRAEIEQRANVRLGGGQLAHSKYYGDTDGNLGNMPTGVVSSPPYAAARIDGHGDEGSSGLRDANGDYLRGAEGWEARKAMGGRYGDSAGNLANLPAGVVSSPPYADGAQHTGGADSKPEHITGGELRYVDYGETPGQLAALPAGVVSSPPYQTGGHHDGVFDTWGGIGDDLTSTAWQRLAKKDGGYGNDPSQLSGDTFWDAARIIVAQTYDLLQPGGVAAWMTGDYARKNTRVPFGEYWLAMCAEVGFVPVLWARVWKTIDHGNQLDIFGQPTPLRKTKVSFFRRLANNKRPESAIENEDVIFVRKPT